jgi:dTDP-4-amino-4,6-dideoxygalactose transaminase
MARKYFYPLVSDYPCYNALSSARTDNLPVATQAAQEVLCLPFHSELSNECVSGIIDIVFKR